MLNRIVMSPRKAARVVGFALLAMFFLAIFAEFVALSNIIVDGDAAATIDNIGANQGLFAGGIVGYIVILALDVIVALGLYVVFKRADETLSLLTAALRLLYTAIMLVGLVALALMFPNTYTGAQLIAYAFFILHLFVLGYLVYRSSYSPKILGILLMIASFCYLIMLYGDFVLPENWYQVLSLIVILPATVAELALAIWLIWKGDEIPEQ